MNKVHIFTHNDLDGAGSYLITSWFVKQSHISVSHTAVNSSNTVREVVLTWLANNSFKDYEKVYFLDLDCYSAKELIDHSNVIIIDHHQTHVLSIEESGPYEHAKSVVKVYTSCIKLLYKIFTRIKPELQLTDAQRSLVVIIDDYDCYKLQTRYAVPLNWVFFSYNNRFDTFITRFSQGFDGFNTQELSMIKIKKHTVATLISNLEIYKGTLGKYSLISAFADDCINELHDHMLNTKQSDITVIVMLSSGRVSWRKQKECDAPLHLLAQRICNGGGHEYAAGGAITEEFQKLAQLLELVPKE